MKNLLIIFLFLTSNIVWGQNIIQNGSFESFMNCPIHISQNNFTPLNDVNFWNSPTNSTPDFFHKCCYVWNWSQPKNVNGWQQPRSGKTYAGLFQLAIDTPIFYYKEYVKNTLSQNLQQNTLYNIRFFISYSCSYCSSGPYNAVVTDSIACYFSDTSVFFNISGNMPVTPQLYDTTGFYTDTLNWIEIRFQYIAQGWENYITIGDFKPYDSLANYQVFHNNGHNNGASYLYIDDVAIWMADTIPPTADAGNDTTICIGGKALLGTHNYSDYYYEWFPTTGLIYDTVGQTYASPNITTKYYLRTTDFTYEKTLDSVTVYVVNCGQNDTTVCIEQSFLLGSTSNPNWNYKWSPPTYLNYDTIGQPLCSPTNDITYSLIIKNSNSDTVSIDTCNVFVANCYSAEAGIDTTLCLGDSIQIGTHNHSSCSYVWWPNQWLSDSTIGMPFAKPDTLTKYFLQVIDTLGNVSKDSILIGVIDCDTVGINQLVINNQELVIYPNPASGYMIVEFNEFQHQDCKFELYDNIGRKVLERILKQGKNQYQLTTENLESGVYFYKLEAAQTYNGKMVISK